MNDTEEQAHDLETIRMVHGALCPSRIITGKNEDSNGDELWWSDGDRIGIVPNYLENISTVGFMLAWLLLHGCSIGIDSDLITIMREDEYVVFSESSAPPRALAEAIRAILEEKGDG